MCVQEVLDLMLVTQYFDTIKDLGHGGVSQHRHTDTRASIHFIRVSPLVCQHPPPPPQGTSLVLTNKRGKAFDAEGMKGIMNKAAAAANASSAAPR